MPVIKPMTESTAIHDKAVDIAGKRGRGADIFIYHLAGNSIEEDLRRIGEQRDNAGCRAGQPFGDQQLIDGGEVERFDAVKAQAVDDEVRDDERQCIRPGGIST